MKRISIILFLFSSIHIYAQQGSTLRNKAIILRRFLEQHHYQPLTWNDSSSIHLYNKWINELDDEKIFFTQKDISALDPLKYKLDDELLNKDPSPAGWSFFNRSIALYKIRLQKTDSIIQVALAKPLDFSKPDNFNWPCTDFAINEADAALRWQRFLKGQVLENIAEAMTEAGTPINSTAPADFAQLEIKAREKTKRQELSYIKNLLQTPAAFISDKEDDYLDIIAWCYDPHSNYMNTKAKKEFDAQASASEYSAGFDLEENDKGDKTISFLQPGGSAWRSGELHTGDVLVKIKTNGTEITVADVDEDELGNFLNGSSEEGIELTVRTTAGEVKTIKINKEKISDEEGIVKSYVLHGNKNIGYINLPGFYSHEEAAENKEPNLDGCANDVSKEIVKLKKDTIAGLILDLRYNGGGSMWEAMQLAGIFIDIGPVASVKDKAGKVHFLKDPNRGTIFDGPLIVLINGASASASEFVSAVLQDYNRAIIVGGATYGKGTAQIVLPMDTLTISPNGIYEDFVKVTTEKFYRVNGSTTQWKGVIPDINLPDLYADDAYKEKANSSALQPDNSKPGIYEILPALPVASLKTKSEQRIATDPYFKTMNEFINWIKQYKSNIIIPLQWNGFAMQYKKNMDMYKLLGMDDKASTPSAIRVTNNGFDRQRIDLSTQHSKAINETYLKHVQKDRSLTEAYNIMMDWMVK